MTGADREALRRLVDAAMRARLGIPPEGEVTLPCSTCDAWKLDAEYPRRTGSLSRRGRASQCRECHNADHRRRLEEAPAPIGAS